MKDCGNVQCKQVHTLLDSFMARFGRMGSPYQYSATKAAIVCDEITRLESERDQLRAELEKAQAACVVFGNAVNLALSQLRESFSGSGLRNYMAFQFPSTQGHEPFIKHCRDVDEAFKTLFSVQLNGATGQPILDRLALAADLLCRAHPNMHTAETGQWFTDVAEFLKGATKE